MSLPVAHGLLGAAVVAASIWGVSLKRDWRFLFLGAVLAILPDFDYFFYRVLGLGEGWHRTFSHSIVFALVTGFLFATLFQNARPRITLVCSLATLSHAILDLLTSKAGGVALFWPLYAERISFGFVSYKSLIIRPTRPLADIMIQFLTISALEFAVFAPIFLATLWINRSFTTYLDS